MPLTIRIKRHVDHHQNAHLTVELGGSLDTATSPELEMQLQEELDDQITDLVFDLAKLTFISSAGLRVFASTRKLMKNRGEQVSFVHLTPPIQEVFEIVKALPGVSVFANTAEFDSYLAVRQRKVNERTKSAS